MPDDWVAMIVFTPDSTDPCRPREIKQFMRGMEGVTLTAQVKEDIMGKLKLALEQGRLILPRDNPQLLVQITAQQCETTKSGTLRFSRDA